MYMDVQKVFNLMKCATAAVKSDRFGHVLAKLQINVVCARFQFRPLCFDSTDLSHLFDPVQ